jgi:NitT/TauT family transport system substrate-binding protein
MATPGRRPVGPSPSVGAFLAERSALVTAMIVTLIVAGCRSGPTAESASSMGPSDPTAAAAVRTGTPPSAGPSGGSGASGASGTSDGLVHVRVGLPFRPNVQFAPLYLAQDRGYYRDAGLEVTFDYGDEADLVRLVAAGERDALIAGGDQVILARANSIPVTYVMTWFQRFPVAVFSLDPALRSPADLVGRHVGLPAPGGTTALGWQALLAANDIDPTRVRTEFIGFTQREAVLSGQVDAALGYANNEPLQLAAEGRPVSVIEVADTLNLVSNGLVVAADRIEREPEQVRALVTATLRGIAGTLADPDAGFEAALSRAPEAGAGEVRDVQRQVLDATLRFWRAPRLGAIDRQAWAASQTAMRSLGLIDRESALEALVDERFLPERPPEP